MIYIKKSMEKIVNITLFNFDTTEYFKLMIILSFLKTNTEFWDLKFGVIIFFVTSMWYGTVLCIFY